ncbi:MAG: TIGR02266 family protein [Thermodesulfobacteriota bacterium]
MPDIMPRDARIPKCLPVTFQQGTDWVKAYARDISRGGLFIVTKNPLQRGDRLTLRLQLPGQDEEMSLSCEVAWIRHEEGQAVTGMGVKFLERSAAHDAVLKPFVTTLERLDVKPFRMSEKDSRILQDCLRDMQQKPPSRPAP